MRHFDLFNFKDVMLFFWPALVFAVLFWLALSYSHLNASDSETRKSRIIYRFPADLFDRDAPVPLAVLLIVIGTVVWGFFYILGHGLLGIKI